MPVPIDITREQAEHLLDCLTSETPIDPPKDVAGLLNLAGACLGAASLLGLATQPDLSPEQQHERRLADRHEAHTRDMAGAVEFLGMVFGALAWGHFDLHFNRHVVGVVNGRTPDFEPIEELADVIEEQKQELTTEKIAFWIRETWDDWNLVDVAKIAYDTQGPSAWDELLEVIREFWDDNPRLTP